MERLNGAGLKILEYKQEYDKNSSEIVREALLTSLELLVQQNIITADAFTSIKNGDSEEQLKKVLLKNPIYKKSPKEMYKEYKKIDEKFLDSLRQAGINGFFETEISVEDERISVLRQYSVNKDFIMLYFGIKEIDLIQLMKKRGFAEKFSVLRLNKVFEEILNEAREDDNITQGKSLVYYNPDIMGFSIDYFYHVNINYIEIPDNIPIISKKISDIDKIVDRKFRRKIGIEAYMKDNQKDKEVTKSSPNNQPKEQKQDNRPQQKKQMPKQNPQVDGRPQDKKSPIKSKNIKPQNKTDDFPAAGDIEEVVATTDIPEATQPKTDLPPVPENFEFEDDMSS